MTKAQKNACKLVNLMIEKAKDTKDTKDTKATDDDYDDYDEDDGMLFFQTQSDPGWNLCMEFCNFLEWPDEDTKRRIEKALNGVRFEMPAKQRKEKAANNVSAVSSVSAATASTIEIEDGLHHAQIYVCESDVSPGSLLAKKQR